MTLTRNQRKAVRLSADNETQTNVTIEVIPGIALAPQAIGCRGHYVTAGGKPIRYPNAYRRAWGKAFYVKSTYKILVGLLWVENVEAK